MNKIIEFTKVTAQGNNYIYLDNRAGKYNNINLNDLSKSVSDIRFGIGSDGLVVYNQDQEADCFMRIFNSDGSEANMCGNALRSIAYLLAKESGNESIKINTLSGIKQATVDINKSIVKVDMGCPIIKGVYKSSSLSGHIVDIGNKHLVVNNQELGMSRQEFLQAAKELQNSSDFPDGINVELVDIISKKKIKAIVYERGSGLTYACGSGATALFWDSYLQKLVDKNVVIGLDGGDLRVSYQKNKVILKGEVRQVCTGNFYWSE